MNTFNLFLQEGFWHITDLNGYDHILFVAALSLSYKLSQYKSLIYMITAFTLGHSIALALAVFNLVEFKPEVIEFLIPLSILLTALHNIVRGAIAYVSPWLYALALGFGLIHGLGFSNYLRFILGQEESLFTPLLAFNLGLEFGQILILIFVLGLASLWTKGLKLPQRYWIWATSLIIAGLALHLCKEKGLALWA